MFILVENNCYGNRGAVERRILSRWETKEREKSEKLKMKSDFGFVYVYKPTTTKKFFLQILHFILLIFFFYHSKSAKTIWLAEGGCWFNSWSLCVKRFSHNYFVVEKETSQQLNYDRCLVTWQMSRGYSICQYSCQFCGVCSLRMVVSAVISL